MFRSLPFVVMTTLSLCSVLLLACLPSCQAANRSEVVEAADLFPYDYKIDDFDNGLRLITIPTDYPRHRRFASDRRHGVAQ